MFPSFGYRTPKTLMEACDLLWRSHGAAKIIAGGTDLVIQLRSGQVKPDTLVDITSLPELRGIEEKQDEVAFGSCVTHAELATSPLVAKYGKILSDSAAQVGSPQIRNLGTIGGNVINASPAADTLPALVALGASATICSREGERVIPVSSLFRAPYEAVIGPHEILLSLSFPKLPGECRSRFIKISRREALAIARLSMAVILQPDRQTGRIRDIRVSAGSVTPTPCRFAEAEEMLKGELPSDERLALASQKISETMIRLSGIRSSTPYKKPVVESLFVRVVKEALEG